MMPEDILKQTRQLIEEHGAGDPDKWWYANRYVFARLQLDERKTKVSIKRALLDAEGPCHSCGTTFETRRNIHLHRLNGSKGYQRGNCVLMHGECHTAWHAEHPVVDSGEPVAVAALTQVRRSKRYDDKPFLYWWDITPQQAETLEQSGDQEFVKKDTGERCVVPVDLLRGYLVPERQTTRSGGNWGVKILKDREDELAFEPGTGGGQWLFLPVVWIHEQDDD